MGYDSDQAVGLLYSLKDFQCIVNGMLIQCSEAFIDKHGAKAHAVALGLYDRRKADCQAECNQEFFSSGQGRHASSLAA